VKVKCPVLINYSWLFNNHDVRLKNEMGGTCGTDGRRADKVLVGRPDGNRTFGKPGRRWEDNSKMDLQDVGWESTDWIDLAQKRDRWLTLVNPVMNLLVPQKVGYFLTS
jgi:hypothetical protein